MYHNELLQCIDIVQEQSIFSELDVLTSLLDTYIKYDTISEQYELADDSDESVVQEAGINAKIDPALKSIVKNTKPVSFIINMIELIKNIFKRIADLIKRIAFKFASKKMIKMLKETDALDKFGRKLSEHIPCIFRSIKDAKENTNELAKSILDLALDTSTKLTTDTFLKQRTPTTSTFDHISNRMKSFEKSFVKFEFDSIKSKNEAIMFIGRYCQYECSITAFDHYLMILQTSYKNIARASTLFATASNALMDVVRRRGVSKHKQYRMYGDHNEEYENLLSYDMKSIKSFGNDLLRYISTSIKSHVLWFNALKYFVESDASGKVVDVVDYKVADESDLRW
jgi:hypothetical protein